MAKLNIAKESVIEKIKQVFGKDYIGENANKHYVWSEGENGRVQISISLTQPKSPLGEVNLGGAFGDGIDFEAAPVIAPAEFKPAEITDEEKQNLVDLMARLGL